MKNKKGQLSLADAPTVVLLVGLVFLVMATIAFIGAKYGDALIESELTSASVINESSFANQTGYIVDGKDQFRAKNFVLVKAWNITAGVTDITSNVTLDSTTGVLRNSTNAVYPEVNLSYNYEYYGTNVAFNTTEDLNTEISNNTSIAGIVLTISLVGIVLTVLIGVFLVTRGAGRS